MTVQASPTPSHGRISYSQSEYSNNDDDISTEDTIGDTTALTSHTEPEPPGACLPTQGNSDERDSFSDKLLYLREILSDELSELIKEAKSTDNLYHGAYYESYCEASKRIQDLERRKSHYKKLAKRLTQEHERLKQEAARAGILEGKINAARDRAMNLFG